MASDARDMGGQNAAPARSPRVEFVGIDMAKVDRWLERAHEGQCEWVARYLWNKAGANYFPFDREQGNLSDIDYAGVVKWMLCGTGDAHGSIYFGMPIIKVRFNAETYFSKARNAWNQKVNRELKARQAENAVTLDPESMRKLKQLASEHNLKGEEFIAIVIDLIAERRGAVKDILKQRKEMKRAAIAFDLGLAPDPVRGGSDYTGSL